eukprot:GHVT01001793.1.p1 GENE.GHVT01001793.1~~GHVT01001793.1.p1  ORF type:complete len:292 (+),score=41.59 GHVT01001793.1:1091-1966(+)
MSYDKLRSFGAIEPPSSSSGMGSYSFSSPASPSASSCVGRLEQCGRKLLQVIGMDAALTLRWSVANGARAAAAAAVGCILGILSSIIVNCTLIEISLSTFFATYFGMLFIVVGVVIFWRLRLRPSETEESRRDTHTLSVFAILIIVSGLLCFFIERSWLLSWPSLFRVPLYGLIGVSVSFALTFALVDLLNFSVGVFQAAPAMSIVEAPNQVRLVLLTATAMGSIFGLIFGLLEVNDSIAFHVRLALLTEERHCLPVGAILGGLCGFGNEVLRIHSKQQAKRRHGSLEDEI